MKRTIDRKDKLDVLALTGQGEEQCDKSSKVIQDLSVCSSDFEVIGSNFQKRSYGEKNESEDERKIQQGEDQRQVSIEAMTTVEIEKRSTV